ncbi:hypothetical protein FOA52_011785 [Chlamydomonas sp. UWO 241]|nr:hypothetical protein FOA52_011785 [Chlamydomonas sp. UWO 241]
MRPSLCQNGLFTTQAVAKGQVLMEVPSKVALIIDFDKGMSVPASGKWPRLKEGLATPEPLNWDLLMALAVIDGLAGDGDNFWQGYCQAILPAPETLTLPMCWSRERLDQLQHADIVDAALRQQERLAAMFPDLMEPAGNNSCSWLQWAFACVRSRAYKLGPDAFAMVPFWDLANHAMEPNGDFRVDPANAGALQLFALGDIPADTEVLLSYTGPEGYTNQRLMAQYGFVLPSGNPGDRLAGLSAPEGSKGLSLEHFQSLLGDDLFLELITARNAYGYAALKSLPLADDTSEPGARDGGRDMQLARSLLKQVSALAARECSTSLEDDEAELGRQERGGGASQQAGGSTSATGGGGTGAVVDYDERGLAALRYRVERKRLFKAVRGLLELYCEDIAPMRTG